MAFKVGVLDAAQRETDSPVRKVKRSVANYLVRKLMARRISKFLIQMVEVSAARIEQTLAVSAGFWDGPLGIGNVLPFSRPTDPLHHSHYEIPMAGDRTCFARHRRKKIRVSARSRAPYAAQPVPTSHMAHALLAG